jgi:hypothetical protein
MHLSLILFTLSFLVTMLAYSIGDRADTDPKDDLEPGEKITWKSTASRFADSLLGDSSDLKVRGHTEDLTFWRGRYGQNNVFMQTRLGLEYSQTLPIGRLLGSYQVATGDFKGWSLTWDGKQSGKRGFSSLLGIGQKSNFQRRNV